MPRWYLKRDGVKETFELIKDYHFVVPSSIDKKKCSNFADYDKISVIMTPGPHFVLGAKPLDNSTVQDCPFLAFDSNHFYGTKTMFLIKEMIIVALSTLIPSFLWEVQNLRTSSTLSMQLIP